MPKWMSRHVHEKEEELRKSSVKAEFLPEEEQDLRNKATANGDLRTRLFARITKER